MIRAAVKKRITSCAVHQELSLIKPLKSLLSRRVRVSRCQVRSDRSVDIVSSKCVTPVCVSSYIKDYQQFSTSPSCPDPNSPVTTPVFDDKLTAATGDIGVYIASNEYLQRVQSKCV